MVSKCTNAQLRGKQHIYINAYFLFSCCVCIRDIFALDNTDYSSNVTVTTEVFGMDKYNTVCMLGQGACGDVYQVIHRETQRCVLVVDYYF